MCSKDCVRHSCNRTSMGGDYFTYDRKKITVGLKPGLGEKEQKKLVPI